MKTLSTLWNLSITIACFRLAWLLNTTPNIPSTVKYSSIIVIIIFPFHYLWLNRSPQEKMDKLVNDIGFQPLVSYVNDIITKQSNIKKAQAEITTVTETVISVTEEEK